VDIHVQNMHEKNFSFDTFDFFDDVNVETSNAVHAKSVVYIMGYI